MSSVLCSGRDVINLIGMIAILVWLILVIFCWFTLLSAIIYVWMYIGNIGILRISATKGSMSNILIRTSFNAFYKVSLQDVFHAPC